LHPASGFGEARFCQFAAVVAQCGMRGKFFSNNSTSTKQGGKSALLMNRAVIDPIGPINIGFYEAW